MNLKTILGWCSALCLSAEILHGQQTNEVELLRQQLKEANDTFQKATQEYRQTIDALNKKLEAIGEKRGKNAAPLVSENKQAAAEAVSITSAAGMTDRQPWTPSQPLTIARTGSAYVNVSLDALLDFGWSTDRDPSRRLQLGDHDPSQRGFTLATTEFSLEGAVDPYFRGFANYVLKLNGEGETETEVEEAYLTTTALPANLQVKAGEFFVNFGRQNSQHAHQWGFVDQPLILNRAFGPEGLRNLGAQFSWLTPLPFYTEAFLTILNSQGQSAFSFRNRGEEDGDRVHGRATIDRGLRGPCDLLFVPRLASSFDLTDQQTMVVGTSAALGPNATGPHSHTEIFGADVYWKWKSPHHHGGFPFLAWQTEGLYQRYEAGEDALAALPSETLRDWGFYTQVLWGFKPNYVAALRGEYVAGNSGAFDAMDRFRGERTRVSPSLTWYPSEFSKLRLQYNYDQGEHFGDEHSVWLQLEFQLGAHAPHKF